MDGILLIGLIGLGITLLVTVLIFLVVIATWRDAKGTSEALAEICAWFETELEQARQDSLEAQQRVRQLEEERPEKLEWELSHATEELERWRTAHSQIQQELGQQKQEWLHRAEQQEQQRLRLEQECGHLMEELERWRWRYVDANQEVTRLREELAEDHRKVEQLTQLRERLLEELREIGKK